MITMNKAYLPNHPVVKKRVFVGQKKKRGGELWKQIEDLRKKAG